MSTVNDSIRGIALPFRLDGGGVAVVEGDAKLRDNLAHILLCGLGERVMHRDYGCGLRQLLQDPNNLALQSIVRHQVLKSVGRWERRVRLTSIDISAEDGVLWIRVEWVALQTKERGSIALPFGMTAP